MPPRERPPGFQASDFIRVRKLPYLAFFPDPPRLIPVMPFHSCNGKFETYLSWEGDELMVLRPLDMAGGKYVGENAAADTDILLPLSTIVFQHFSTNHIMDRLREIEADFENSLASIQKYFVILHHANTSSDFTDAAMMRSEIELAFTNHRSMYDQLNKMVAACVKLVFQSSRDLPSSFADTLKKKDADLASQHGLPLPLIEFYRALEPAFLLLRDVRDGIVHQGHSNESWIFNFTDGFAIDVERGFLARLAPLKLWPHEVRRINNENLGSLLALFAYLVRDIIAVMRGAAEALASIQLPPSIASNHRIYLRSRLSMHARNANEYLQRQWREPAEILGGRPR